MSVWMVLRPTLVSIKSLGTGDSSDYVSSTPKKDSSSPLTAGQ